MDYDADVIVVGLGAMGSTTLWRLAERGIAALGIDQYRPGHPHGSSHGGSRLFRVACLEGPEYVTLAQLALRMWRSLETSSGAALLEQTGGVMIGAPDSATITGTLRAARAHDLPHEVLDADQLRKRYPQHAVSDGVTAVVDPQAGILSPERAIHAAVAQAERRGATVVSGERVTAVRPENAGVAVVTPGRTYRARRAVLSAGAWSSTLLPELRLPLKVVRQVMTWFRPRPGREPLFGPDRFPIFIRELPGDAGAWGCGLHAGLPVKVGPEQFDGAPVDPDAVDRAVHADDFAAAGGFVRSCLPDLDPAPVSAQTCLMTLTPDRHFVLGGHDALPNLTLLAGFSGHGLKHAAGVGEVAAALAAGAEAPVPVGLIDAKRFG